jgi:hypothetical protein
MEWYQWNRLNKQQVGTYVEYFVKMELTMADLQMYTIEESTSLRDMTTGRSCRFK